jgi:hypothetical protein
MTAYVCWLCTEPGIHTHRGHEIGQGMTTYRLERTADRSLVIETHDRNRFVEALRDLYRDHDGLYGFKAYTITVTEVSSGDDAPSAAWSFIR